MRYNGKIINQITGDEYTTTGYTVWIDAYNAAVKLAKRTGDYTAYRIVVD